MAQRQHTKGAVVFRQLMSQSGVCAARQQTAVGVQNAFRFAVVPLV